MNSIPQLVAQTALDLGVDPSLALAVASAESGFSQSAVSRAGAIGVMQLMPATAAALGVNPNDVTQNIQGGIRYLGQMLAQFGGDIVAAVGAYNWGPGNVASAIASYGADWLSYAPAETRGYVAKVTGSAADTALSAVSSVDVYNSSDGGGSPASSSGWVVPAAVAAAALLISAALIDEKAL